MNTPQRAPVTAAEIADLTAQLRALSPPQPGDTAARAAFLATKADLLARIADQHSHDGPCDHAAQARQVAAHARVVADHARALVIDAEDNTP